MGRTAVSYCINSYRLRPIGESFVGEYQSCFHEGRELPRYYAMQFDGNRNFCHRVSPLEIEESFNQTIWHFIFLKIQDSGHRNLRTTGLYPRQIPSANGNSSERKKEDREALAKSIFPSIFRKSDYARKHSKTPPVSQTPHLPRAPVMIGISSGLVDCASRVSQSVTQSTAG